MTDDKKERERVQDKWTLYEAWRRLLPDARTSRPRGLIYGPLGSMQRIYCVNCGADGGYVTEFAITDTFYLCDDCVLVHGALPMPEVPEELVRGREPQGG